MASKTQSGRDVSFSGQNGAKAPALYQGFDGQYIDGSWRPGKHGGVRLDTDPYSGGRRAIIHAVAFSPLVLADVLAATGRKAEAITAAEQAVNLAHRRRLPRPNRP
jgi:hypothetical protein